MKLTVENLKQIPIGQRIFIPHAFKIPDSYIYMGEIQQDWMIRSNHKMLAILNLRLVKGMRKLRTNKKPQIRSKPARSV
jgi:hypothetical protein